MTIICNCEIEPVAIHTAKNQLICFRIIFWDNEDTPVYKIDPCNGEPEKYSLEYDKSLEQKLIEALKQSEILTVTIEDRKIILIK